MWGARGGYFWILHFFEICGIRVKCLRSLTDVKSEFCTLQGRLSSDHDGGSGLVRETNVGVKAAARPCPEGPARPEAAAWGVRSWPP